MPASLQQLVSCANALLQPELFSDYCPNGLQVAGQESVARLITGVTASRALLEAAIEVGADAILVHHGYFWRGEDPCLVGMKRERLALLLQHNISLLAYHLPLDAHARYGNNAQLAARLGITVDDGLEAGNPRSIGNVGHFDAALTPRALAARLRERLGREPLVEAAGSRPIRHIAWCTGAAQGYLKQAASRGVDAYLTGEASEQTIHEARELGIHFFAAGHHATERYGAPAVGDYLAAELAIEHRFIDIDNPV